MSKISVAVLGATGMIGQRFIQMLEDHPYFEIEGLYASERSNGKKLSEVLKVRDHVYLDDTMDRTIETMDISKIAKNCRIAFSGIPSDLAGPTESQLAEAGVAVFTNAGSHRMDPHVPILIPEVNPEQFEAVKDQPTYNSTGGYIVTNANCSSTGIAAPLKAIDDAFGLKQVFVSTYQALSGAGYPGVPSLDAVGNVVPFINHEEEKMESELAKMLGTYERGEFRFAPFKVMSSSPLLRSSTPASPDSAASPRSSDYPPHPSSPSSSGTRTTDPSPYSTPWPEDPSAPGGWRSRWEGSDRATDTTRRSSCPTTPSAEARAVPSSTPSSPRPRACSETTGASIAPIFLLIVIVELLPG